MRLLVACPECRRQYEAGKLRPGAKFRCRCGRVLRVKAPRGHDAAVIRCSGCGAPREQGGRACSHCGSDFTLHERDMHTVCPHCLTRVSDKANYCHSCGKALTATDAAGEASDLECVSCDANTDADITGEGGRPRLHSRRLGKEDLSVLECQVCAGMWIESRVFRELTNKAEQRQAIDPAILAPSKTEHAGSFSGRKKWSYRPCPECGKLMVRRNYGRRSGVIIDVCRDHGIWFDANELQRILRWIREGGSVDARRRAYEEQREKDHRRKIAAATQPIGYDDDSLFTWQTGRGGGADLIDAFIDSLFGF